jgi:hypothetical protein
MAQEMTGPTMIMVQEEEVDICCVCFEPTNGFTQNNYECTHTKEICERCVEVCEICPLCRAGVNACNHCGARVAEMTVGAFRAVGLREGVCGVCYWRAISKIIVKPWGYCMNGHHLYNCPICRFRPDVAIGTAADSCFHVNCIEHAMPGRHSRRPSFSHYYPKQFYQTYI